jgi:hypothetical protein
VCFTAGAAGSAVLILNTVLRHTAAGNSNSYVSSSYNSSGYNSNSANNSITAALKLKCLVEGSVMWCVDIMNSRVS